MRNTHAIHLLLITSFFTHTLSLNRLTAAVSKPWAQRDPQALSLVCRLLSGIALRHAKSQRYGSPTGPRITSLPPVVRTLRPVDLPPAGPDAYVACCIEALAAEARATVIS